MAAYTFFDRDISWLSFNERVLQEAAKSTVPLLERFRFLSIFSSNLDEFYRVRMPAIKAVEKIDNSAADVYRQVTAIIDAQLDQYGYVLNKLLIPELKQHNYALVNDGQIPGALSAAITNYFFTHVAGLVQPVLLNKKDDYFPENNQLYLAVIEETKNAEHCYLVNIPCEKLERFHSFSMGETKYIIYLEDIIKVNLQHLFPGKILGAYNIKITRDAELNLKDDYEADLAEKIEEQLHKRDMGFATRFLYQPQFPLRYLQYIIDLFSLKKASVVEGGMHHNLRDLFSLPVQDKRLLYPPQPPQAAASFEDAGQRLFNRLEQQDLVVHAPYMSYDTIIRFFNEAAIDHSVEEIYTTLYRVASNSRIAEALISAAANGKKVMVLVELKARFDEANNIAWARKMKDAGVHIVYSSNKLKVHAKAALVKRKQKELPLLGLLATGNLNESTARFYTDHILLTAHQPMLLELQHLFGFLAKSKLPGPDDRILFNHLLVAQFNLLPRFLGLIDREIENAGNGMPAAITIKLNNLEEETLIAKLYEASNAGVTIHLIVRSICRLVPGIEGQSKHIRITRIVDRYLEHGRVFVFHNNGEPEVFMGSADWMKRNIYRRIEVCFPVYDQNIRSEMLDIINLQVKDTVSAVTIDNQLRNQSIAPAGETIRSQEAIYKMITG